MKINVLYIIWSLGLGGAERVVINLAEGLDKNKFRPVICCLNEEGPFAEEIKQRGIKVIALNKMRGFDPFITAKIMNVIKKERAHVVHTHLWGANFWGRIAGALCRTPVVITEHNADVWKKPLHKWIDRLLARFTHTICVVSQSVKDFYVRDVGLDEKRIKVVYNGIPIREDELTNNQKLALKSEFGITNGSMVITNIGRLVPAKANHIFLAALRILRLKGVDVKALIVGDGPLKNTLIKENQDLIDQNVLQFTGMRDDVDHILDISDISVLSSSREGLSIVILEAMAKGVPFVATKVGGNPEQIVDGETGYLVAENDPEGMAKALDSIINDRQLAGRMRMAAKARARQYFSLDVMVGATEKIYEKAVVN